MSKELEALRRVVSEIDKYKLYGIGDENWLGIQDVLKDISTIENALQQAQKQEKLLELYKQAYDKSNAEVLKMFTMKQDEKTTLNNIIGHLDEKTVVQIKELENEV